MIYTSEADGLTTTRFKWVVIFYILAQALVEPAEKDRCVREKGELCPDFPPSYTCFACMDTHLVIIETVGGAMESLPSL